MPSVLETLRERGFVQQCTDESGLQELLAKKAVNFYCGFDPTAESLHCGSLMPIMAMAHLQRAGHKPIAIIGGGTAMIGDPSGKTDLRKMLTPDEIGRNGQGILGQLQRYLTLDGTKGLFVNNADWLMPLRYIDFLREIGRHFKVNEMIRAEAYRQRLEREEGLTFIEFNYQLLQAYDYLLLNRQQGCRLQIGGDDQWSNILAGLDLIRKDQGKQSYGLTFPLLTTARGEKMGKTAGGAVWLSEERTSPYAFYQYWVNVDDRDVERFLAYFTFLPMDEVRQLGKAEGAALNDGKRVLAYEATRLCHGEEEAEKAKKAAEVFVGGDADLSAIPTTNVERDAFAAGIGLVDLLVKTGLADSKKAAKRLIEQGGAYVEGVAVSDVNHVLREDALKDGALLLRQGKKKYHRVVVD
ncbi:MAG: tyrosine--tRNA ligase [Gemmataceae bacterium]|nr:tyrosine--tRNA ligase [Gemmataceae bacterium]